MPKPKNEEYITLSDLAKEVYKLTGVTRGKSTMFKWAKNGRPDAHGGKIIKLKTTRRLGGQYSTVAWLKKFIKEIG